MTSIFDLPEFNDSLFYPSPEVSPPPPGARDLTVEVDGAQLHVRCHAGPPGAPTLLLFHGNGEVVADYDDAAERFAGAGVALAVADYRGYGASTGEPTLRNSIEDARAVAEAVQPAIVMGRSLGGAAAHELYAAPVATMRAVVLESAFSDVDAMIRRRGLVPPPRYTDAERATFDPLHKLGRGRLPLLILHGDRDQLVAPADALAALDAAGGISKELVLVPGHGHNDVSMSPVYWEALAAFVDCAAGSPV